jgi:hypothetical protein
MAVSKIGYVVMSLSFCVRDILNGSKEREDVLAVQANTKIESFEDMELVCNQYHKTFWRDFNIDDCMDLVGWLIFNTDFYQERVEFKKMLPVCRKLDESLDGAGLPNDTMQAPTFLNSSEIWFEVDRDEYLLDTWNTRQQHLKNIFEEEAPKHPLIHQGTSNCQNPSHPHFTGEDDYGWAGK